MTKDKKHYAPWSRTEDEDLKAQKALDTASANQMAGFVDELLEKADRDADGEDEASAEG